MSTPPTRRESLTAYNQRIDDIMPLERWKAIKGGFFALITIVFATFVVSTGGDPTAVWVGSAILLAIYYGVELHEVQLVKGVKITFSPEDEDSQDEAESDD